MYALCQMNRNKCQMNRKKKDVYFFNKTSTIKKNNNKC